MPDPQGSGTFSMIRLRATATHPDLPEGAVYDAAPVFAASHMWLGYAVEAPDTEITTRDLKAEEPANSTLPKRSYRRRDMKAER